MQQLASAATQLLVIMDATDFLGTGPKVPRRDVTIAMRIRSILLAQGQVGLRRIIWELANDGHGAVTQGAASGTLNTMKKRGLVTYSTGKWHLITGEPPAVELCEQEEG